MMLGTVGEPFVTILFAEIAGIAAPSDEAAGALRRDRLAVLRRTLDEHGGREVRSTGEGLMVAFGSAVSGLRCAVAMQRELGEDPLRVGLDAGEPLGEGEDIHGTTVVVAERLCELAEPGEILASEVVCRIAGPRVGEAIRPIGALRLRGVAERIPAANVAWGETETLPDAGTPVREISVVVADDQRLLRAGFRVILDAEPGIRVVGEASDGRAAVDVVKRRRPDVVLMDIRMPELDGLKAAELLLADPELDTAVIMLTTFDLNEYVYEALRIGASGFMLKDAPSDRLVEAVRVAAAGDALLAPSITRRLIGQFARASRPAPGDVPERLEDLTARELDVLRLVARGLSNAEIAAELILGENTIKTHVAHLLGKLGLRDRVQAVVVAYETGLVTPEL
jgi:DNA-binding NarL/FixJ family response regulator